MATAVVQSTVENELMIAMMTVSVMTIWRSSLTVRPLNLMAVDRVIRWWTQEGTAGNEKILKKREPQACYVLMQWRLIWQR